MKGQKPKPAAIRRAEGKRGHRPILDPPQPTGGPPICPKWLRGEARRAWDHVLRAFDGLDVLASVDVGTLSAYCVSLARWAAAERRIDRQGAIIRVLDKTGKATAFVQANPAVSIALRYQDRVRHLAAELGLSPSARMRLGTEKKSRRVVDDLEQMLSAPRPKRDRPASTALYGTPN